MAKMDVGGNGALTLQEYTAYGLRATTGMNRNEVEGIRVGGANGANDNYFSDFASFAEIAVKAVGHSAAMPVPGTMAQYVSKSGGNTYRGSVYADVQSDAWQATNIDDDQIARGVSGGPGLDARDVNRLERFRDFTADVGGYLKKDRAWWYAAYRDTEVGQRYAWLLDTRGHADGQGCHRQAHLQAVAAPEAGRLPAARDLRAVELLRQRHEPAGPDQRRASEHRVSGDRLEGRVQRWP